jgi:hypothetical protein
MECRNSNWKLRLSTAPNIQRRFPQYNLAYFGDESGGRRTINKMETLCRFGALGWNWIVTISWGKVIFHFT